MVGNNEMFHLIEVIKGTFIGLEESRQATMLGEAQIRIAQKL